MDIGFPIANKKSHSTSSQNCHFQLLLAYMRITAPLLIGPLARALEQKKLDSGNISIASYLETCKKCLL